MIFNYDFEEMAFSPNKIFSVFNSTTNSYKYYWWYAIILVIKNQNKESISFDEIAIQMLVLVWYPINYFKISLGKQDQLSRYIKEIKYNYSLPDNIKETDLFAFLQKHKNETFITQIISKIIKYVPYRFIRPWFPNLPAKRDGVINGLILKLQHNISQQPPYFIDKIRKQIIFNDKWKDWLNDNIKSLESFTLFELFKYVEKNNPYTTNISTKLFKPQQRKLTLPIKLWIDYINSASLSSSIFEKRELSQINQISIDHFLPWSFVTHDQLWNLHPVEIKSNSSKGNKLPHSSYLRRFCELQFDFVRFLLRKNEKFLTDYINFLMIRIDEIKSMSKEKFVSSLESKISLQIQIASNMGFETDWHFSHS